VDRKDLTPTPTLAATVAEMTMGRVPTNVRRFRMGVAHYVFEVEFADGSSVVVRAGTPERRSGLADGVHLNTLLRLLGVPLPKVLATGTDLPLPWVVLERLPGTDLGEVIDSLSDQQLGAIAKSVAQAQAVTARLGAVKRYGYAAKPEDAPKAVWSAVLEANLARSRARILTAGLFGSEPVETVAELIAYRRVELDARPAIAFLHDTTTRNVIVAPTGSLSGIVDVDDLCFGDPRYAPALTLVALLASGRPATYVDAWMRASGYQDDRIFRLYVALFLVDFMSEHGQRFNGNERPSTSAARATLLQAFTQVVSQAEA